MPELRSDSELLLLWQQGDESAFEALYKKYAVKLLAVAMQKTGDRITAEEIVQDSFLSFYKNKQSLTALSSVLAFLYVILKNKIMDKYRHDFVRRKYEDHLFAYYNEADHSTTAFIETRELEKLLNEEIEKLPQQCRTVFNLSRKQYFSNKEIANSLQISENTVEQHMRKALRILRGSILNHIKMLF
ncbi:RNA polymerase sigma-70 factor [Pedobacter sp. AW31-3R]|uniref:RNA polymerase sigma-70 factor n=1 Tax=Pedobacter sp. AW31-3R TaxID=3445781 RepID=UPI003FA0C975